MEIQPSVSGLLNDPLTGLGTRQALLDDLAKAVVPTATPSVLAIFDLGGFKDYQRAFGVRAAEDLIVTLSTLFRTAIEQTGTGYRPREDELVTLLDAPQDAAEPILAGIVTNLRRAGKEFLITTSYGAALLPDEAEEPIGALAVADRRLQAITGRGPRDRRRSPRSRQDAYLDALREQQPDR
jgi:two-component system, cell cycle response regulator